MSSYYSKTIKTFLSDNTTTSSMIWGINIIDSNIKIIMSSLDKMLNFDENGNELSVGINIINSHFPSALVCNHNINSFIINNNLVYRPAIFIICTLRGTIHGYNYSLDPIATTMVIDNSFSGSIYTGITICNDKLFVSDYGNKKILVFDNHFIQLQNYSFMDLYHNDLVPSTFSPYNISNINEKLYVIYVKQNSTNKSEIFGNENGYINIFDDNGNFISRFTSKMHLNTPYGISPCPHTMNFPNNGIIVSNFGNGTINIYDANGQYTGKILDHSGNNLVIPGIRSIDIESLWSKNIFWTATEYNFKKSSYGKITMY